MDYITTGIGSYQPVPKKNLKSSIEIKKLKYCKRVFNRKFPNTQITIERFKCDEGYVHDICIHHNGDERSFLQANEAAERIIRDKSKAIRGFFRSMERKFL